MIPEMTEPASMWTCERRHDRKRDFYKVRTVSGKSLRSDVRCGFVTSAFAEDYLEHLIDTASRILPMWEEGDWIHERAGDL